MNPASKLGATLAACALLVSSAWAGETVDINTASTAQLAAALDGIGESKAQAIVDYRDRHGPFRHIDELVKVKGIGLNTVDRNRDAIIIQATGASKAKPKKAET